jgi:cystathionine beta-lyase/cystathionine gamma-synthase
MNRKKHQMSLFSIVTHDSHDERHHGSINVPVYQTSLFSFESYEQLDLAKQDEKNQFIYSRGNNPTVRYLEEKVALMEQGDVAKCFASGMAAISAAILSIVKQGDHIICTHQAYGPTKEFLGSYINRFGIETTFVDGKSMDAWKEAVRPNTKLLYLESPTTLLFELQDLRACVELAEQIGAETIIDNSWATPFYQTPLTLGVGLVVHSMSKYFSGHSDCIGGVVVGSHRLMDRIRLTEYMLFGGIMTPQTAALITRGLRTLPLRMQWHEASGLTVAEHLSKQPFVSRVNHPGLPSHPQHELACSQMYGYSSLFSFESDEPIEKLRKWADRLKFFKIGPSWGGFESLITVNAISAVGYSTTLVRLYIGMENPDDLIQDMDETWISL